ncbi:MAG: HNH endonuclease [Clostridiales Family XIII bacterium]|nr:HNH endonuclease [Clostridiales Family XIII bacterium]
MRKYTDEMAAWLAANIAGTDTEKLTVRFNARFGTDFALSSVRAAIKNRGLSSGVNCRFKKGGVSHNKGRKGIHASPNSEFKPGHMPVTHRPVGSERTNADGYAEIKTAEPRTWELKHRVIWESVHGEIPNGHIIVFADKDKRNFDIENLMAVPRKKAAIINHNGLAYGDPDTLTSALALAGLCSAAVAAEKRLKERTK